MFKKIISNLAFSPAIVGQLGFYAKRLKKEELTRKTGLVFVALSLIVQILAVLQPPQATNASSPNDLVNGGLNGSLSNFLKAYDNDTKLRSIMNYAQITRSEIATAKKTTFSVKNKFSWGYLPRFSYAQGERKHRVTNLKGELITDVYSRPLSLWHGPNVYVTGWIGYSPTNVGWFAVMNSCGNLVTEKLPEYKVKKPDKPTQPETPNITFSKTATNTSQGFIDATSIKASANDQISFTISVKNEGTEVQKVKLTDHLMDTLEYSKLIDSGGGTLNNDTKILSWPDINLNPSEIQTRTFVVRLYYPIPSNPEGISEPTEYDCIMTNTFGNSLSISVNCPTPKVVERVVKELPETGPTENMIFGGLLLAIAMYFYMRNRLLEKEVRLIRKQITIGSL